MEKPKKQKKRLLYSPLKVQQALEAVKTKSMNVHKASQVFKIPRSTLRSKLDGKAPEAVGKFGPDPILGQGVEEAIRKWVEECARNGFPINKELILDSVQMFLKKENINTPFKDGRPGRKWFDSLRKRYPDIRLKHAEFLCASRASVTETKIRAWFQNVTELLGSDIDILEKPERIFNSDETAFSLTPKGDLVVVPRGESVYYDVSRHSDKTNITTLVTVNAEGLIAPPMTVYNYSRVPKAVLDQAPEGWVIGNTDHGWMTSQCFFEYVANPFLSWLKANDIEFPIILFLDGHRSHLTLPLTRFCRENRIILVALPPNATHIMQPLDVAVFASMKTRWKSLLRKYRFDHDGQEITKSNVAVGLKMLMEEPQMQDCIRAGFKACGLFPFDENAVNYRKCVGKNPPTRPVETAPRSLTHLDYLESKITPQLLCEFNETAARGTDWEGDISAGMLYDLWMEAKHDNKADDHSAAPSTAVDTGPAPASSIDISSDVVSFQGSSSNEGNDCAVTIPQSSTISQEVVPSQSCSFSEGKTCAVATPHSSRIPSEPPSSHSGVSFSPILNPSPYDTSTPPSRASPFGKIVKPSTARNLEDVFKDVTAWMGKSEGKKKVLNPKIPVTVLTHEQHIKFQEIAELEKQKKEEEKTEKRLAREAKRKQKAEAVEKKKSAKKQKKSQLDADESSEDDELPDLEGDESLDDVDPFHESSDESEVEQETFFETCQPKVKDYVLVEFASKKGKKYYVGQVTATDNADTRVNFLKRGGDMQSYRPKDAVEDEWVETASIKKILPVPLYRQRYYRFNVKFPRLNIE